MVASRHPDDEPPTINLGRPRLCANWAFRPNVFCSSEFQVHTASAAEPQDRIDYVDYAGKLKPVQVQQHLVHW